MGRKKKQWIDEEYFQEYKLTCKDCCCSSCSQQDNCAMNGCDGGGCTNEDLAYFKHDCDDYEPSID